MHTLLSLTTVYPSIPVLLCVTIALVSWFFYPKFIGRVHTVTDESYKWKVMSLTKVLVKQRSDYFEKSAVEEFDNLRADNSPTAAVTQYIVILDMLGKLLPSKRADPAFISSLQTAVRSDLKYTEETAAAGEVPFGFEIAVGVALDNASAFGLPDIDFEVHQLKAIHDKITNYDED